VIQKATTRNGIMAFAGLKKQINKANQVSTPCLFVARDFSFLACNRFLRIIVKEWQESNRSEGSHFEEQRSSRKVRFYYKASPSF